MRVNLQYLMSYLIAVVLAIPALLVVCVAAVVIIIVDHYSPWFVQERIGRDGKIITVYKLQTMRPKLPHQEYRNREHDAERITKFGAWLQERGIDELPQLWNVLTGTMTLVGPRTLMASTYAVIEARNADNETVTRKIRLWRIRRQTRLPGITGLHQICYGSENIISCDMLYVDDSSWGNYWSILFESMWVLYVGKTKIRNAGFIRGNGEDVVAVR